MGDARSVVFDMDELFAGVFQMDFDGRGPGIDRILNAFFDDGGGAFNNLARGDLCDDI